MHKYTWFERILFLPTYIKKEKLREELHGKTILITGASSGIGRELSYFLADLDVHLVVVARRKEILFSMKEEIEKKNAKVSVYRADLRVESEVEGLLAYIQQLPRGLDIIVSNAGKSIMRSIFESTDRFHDFQRTMSLNYFAPVKLLLSLISMLEKNRGQIIHISTINTMLLPFPFWSAYQASKSAFDTWFQSAAPELNTRGISTSSIYLPLVRTPMIVPTKAYRKVPAMNPLHVAQIISKCMYTKRRKFRPWWLIFGQVASMLFRGLYERVMPGILRKRGK
jgi:short-subunit dehydrogenase